MGLRGLGRFQHETGRGGSGPLKISRPLYTTPLEKFPSAPDPHPPTAPTHPVGLGLEPAATRFRRWERQGTDGGGQANDFL